MNHLNISIMPWFGNAQWYEKSIIQSSLSCFREWICDRFKMCLSKNVFEGMKSIYSNMNIKRMQMPTVLSGTSQVFFIPKLRMAWGFQKIDFYNCRMFSVRPMNYYVLILLAYVKCFDLCEFVWFWKNILLLFTT